jgi:hypothetical protein
MSNVFDDIYNKKLNLNFRNLNTKKETFEEESFKADELEENTLDLLFSNLYNKFDVDDVHRYTNNEIKIIDEKIKRSRIAAEGFRKELENLKSNIIEEVKGKAFSLDIRKSQILKKACNNIFGGNKDYITYEDYLVLLEMKQQIILNEASDILSEN